MQVLIIIMLDSVIKANKNYYPQALLEKCKYVQEKIKTNYNDDDLKKVNQIGTLLMKQSPTLIMMNKFNKNILIQ